MKKFILLAIIILTIAWLGLSYCTQHQAKETPSITQAPYLVETLTRIYYAKDVSGVSPNIIMKCYYEWDREQWVFHNITLRFNKNMGEIRVTDRRTVK